MKRTIREWLEHIADPIVRGRLTNNVILHKVDMNAIRRSVEGILGSFDWDKTPEGFDYWYDIYGNIELLPFND